MTKDVWTAAYSADRLRTSGSTELLMNFKTCEEEIDSPTFGHFIRDGKLEHRTKTGTEATFLCVDSSSTQMLHREETA